MSILTEIRNRTDKADKAACIKPGYYFKYAAGNPVFISAKINLEALEKVADKILNDKIGYEYWIDYSSGIDTAGNPAWANMDYSDDFC